jgi:hypothetical protein
MGISLEMKSMHRSSSAVRVRATVTLPRAPSPKEPAPASLIASPATLPPKGSLSHTFNHRYTRHGYDTCSLGHFQFVCFMQSILYVCVVYQHGVGLNSSHYPSLSLSSKATAIRCM